MPASTPSCLRLHPYHTRGHPPASCAPPPPAQSERNTLQASLSEARRAGAAAREQHERLLLEHEADAKAREAAVVEAKARELADLREAGLRERSELDSKYREQLEAVQSRAASLDSEARALREQKYGLDARVSELSHKLGAAEGSNRWVGGEGGEGGKGGEARGLRGCSSMVWGQQACHRALHLPAVCGACPWGLLFRPTLHCGLAPCVAPTSRCHAVLCSGIAARPTPPGPALPCPALPAIRSLSEEVERLRVLSSNLGREKAERDVELGEALTKVRWKTSWAGCDLSRQCCRQRPGRGRAPGHWPALGTLLWLEGLLHLHRGAGEMGRPAAFKARCPSIVAGGRQPAACSAGMQLCASVL